jgi:hypothetical protein
VYRQYSTYDVQVKDNSAFTGGRTVIDKYEYLYADRLGLPFAHRIDSFVNAERGASFEKGQLRNVKRQTFTPDDIAKIGRDVTRTRSGVGREKAVLGGQSRSASLSIRSSRGPLSVTRHRGFSHRLGLRPVLRGGPLKFAYKHRKRMRAFYVEDPYGFPDVARLHWDPSRRAGPRAAGAVRLRHDAVELARAPADELDRRRRLALEARRRDARVQFPR